MMLCLCWQAVKRCRAKKREETKARDGNIADLKSKIEAKKNRISCLQEEIKNNQRLFATIADSKDLTLAKREELLQD